MEIYSQLTTVRPRKAEEEVDGSSFGSLQWSSFLPESHEHDEVHERETDKVCFNLNIIISVCEEQPRKVRRRRKVLGRGSQLIESFREPYTHTK